MLKFLVLQDGQPPERWPLRNCYLIGSDGNAMRGEITFADGLICADKREAGNAALAMQYPVGDLGEITLQTCLLPERDEPYILALELARHRLMTLYNKLEDWGMFDLDPDHAVTRRVVSSRRLFVEAVSIARDDPTRAEKLATDSLLCSLDGSEELALAHSELLLARRRAVNALPRHAVGCGVALHQNQPPAPHLDLLNHFDFIQVPVPWKYLAPEEGDYRWEQLDGWITLAQRRRQPLIAGPLVCFDPANLPDWLYIWEHDYDTVRDLIYEHVERVVSRYRNSIRVWKVVSGLHVNSHFSFNFEQLMDLTRMAVMLVKKVQPNARVVIELRQPFGEYFAGNARSIPPMMYADLIVQSAIAFDAFAIDLAMGQPIDGQFTRDLMQVSHLLDQFSTYGKPVYLTVAAPSQTVTQLMIASPDGKTAVDPSCGHWRRPWSPTVQSHWLAAVMQIAVSKPFIEAVAWRDLLDHAEIALPLGGLIDEDHQPKAALKRLVSFRRSLTSGAPGDVAVHSPAATAVMEEVPIEPAPPIPKDPDPNGHG